jgi:hypothetical protein
MSNSTTLLDTIATNQSNKEAVVNALLDAASPAMLWGRHASACSGLTWGFYGGQFSTYAIANGTVTLTASTTNYVYADNVTGAVSVNTTGVPSGKIALYTIVTGATTVTSYTDLRQSGSGSSGGGGGALSGLSDVNVTEGSGINNNALVWNNSTSKWVAAPRAYDIAINFEGVTTNGEIIRVKMVRAVTLPASLTGSSFDAGTAATASTVFTLKQNGSSIGTITFAASGTTGTVSFASAVTFSAGDTFEIDAPATADATLANIAFTFAGSY